MGLDKSGTGSRVQRNLRLIPRPLKELTFLKMRISSLYTFFADFAIVVYLPDNFLEPSCPCEDIGINELKEKGGLVEWDPNMFHIVSFYPEEQPITP